MSYLSIQSACVRTNQRKRENGLGIVRKRQSRSCAVGSGFSPDPTVDPTPDPIDGQPAGSGFTPDPTVDPTPDPIDGQPQGLPRQNKQLTNNK